MSPKSGGNVPEMFGKTLERFPDLFFHIDALSAVVLYWAWPFGQISVRSICPCIVRLGRESLSFICLLFHFTATTLVLIAMVVIVVVLITIVIISIIVFDINPLNTFFTVKTYVRHLRAWILDSRPSEPVLGRNFKF